MYQQQCVRFQQICSSCVFRSFVLLMKVSPDLSKGGSPTLAEPSTTSWIKFPSSRFPTCGRTPNILSTVSLPVNCWRPHTIRASLESQSPSRGGLSPQTARLSSLRLYRRLRNKQIVGRGLDALDSLRDGDLSTVTFVFRTFAHRITSREMTCTSGLCALYSLTCWF